VVIDATRHLAGRHLGPEPLVMGDAPAGALLGDLIDANRERATELIAVRDKVRQAMGPQARATEAPKPRA
jgi:hypothetical protein